MLYESERKYLATKISQLLSLGILNSEGGGFSLRLADGNILATPTGASFRLWQVNPEDFLISDPEGKVLEKGKYLAVADFPVDLHIFSSFALANSIVHLHAPYSLAFASLAKDIPPTTNLISTILPVPCLPSVDEDVLKKNYLANPYSVNIPDAVVKRPEVYIVFQRLIEKIDNQMLSRKDELQKHGLAFTVEKHGLFVIAKNIDEAIENAIRVEAAARTAIYSKIISHG
jgi:ribulose-5-phosphate 4-epimerase/fuculose-1-phosphate aldolase